MAFGTIIAFIIVVALVIYVVLPLSGVILLCIVGAGFCSGVFVAVRDIWIVVSEAHKHER